MSLGGSVIYNTHGINVDYLSSTVDLIRKYSSYTFIYVVGGGNVARSYIQAAANAGIDKQGQDMLGIEATRLNAMLFALILARNGLRSTNVRNIFEVHPYFLEQYQVIVTGGTIPGHTTDRVAVQCANKFGSDSVINVTEVGYIYDKDPRKHNDARVIEKIKGSELIDKWGLEHQPGMNLPIEPKAVQEAIEHKIKIYVIGPSIEDLEKIITGNGYKGTLILPE
ncbi:MAG: UMP kinase [Candidatus Aenigmatarchaeota archaeon]